MGRTPIGPLAAPYREKMGNVRKPALVPAPSNSQNAREQARAWCNERIDDRYPSPGEAILQIFTQQQAAMAFRRDGLSNYIWQAQRVLFGFAQAPGFKF